MRRDSSRYGNFPKRQKSRERPWNRASPAFGKLWEHAGKCRVDLTYEIDFIGKLCMEDIDMCALLANLLNNSVEACEKIEKDKRWINLRIKKQNEMLFIWIENSMKERKIEKSKFFETNKEDKKLHGLGMKSIDNVIKKYDGHKEYEIQKDKFLIYISIPIN